MLETNRVKQNVTKEKIESLQSRKEEEYLVNTELKKKYKNIIKWADIFEGSGKDVQRTIVSHIIDRVVVSDGCKIDVTFKINALEYLDYGYMLDTDSDPDTEKIS